MSEEVSAKLLQRCAGQPKKISSLVDLLTDREFEIFQLIGRGLSQKEIGRQLNITNKTVSVHNANIRQKLDLDSTALLIRLAVQCENVGEDKIRQHLK